VVVSGSVYLVGEARTLLLAGEGCNRDTASQSLAPVLPLAHQCTPDPVMTVVTAVCGSISLLASYVEKGGRAQQRIARFWARALVRLTGCSLTIRGAENLRKVPVAVYASNHTSYFDTPVIFAALPFQFRILAKKELWPIAFIGWYLDRSGQIPINTANPRATLSSLAVGVKALRAGMPLFIFPRASGHPPARCRTFSPAQPIWLFAPRCRWSLSG